MINYSYDHSKWKIVFSNKCSASTGRALCDKGHHVGVHRVISGPVISTQRGVGVVDFILGTSLWAKRGMLSHHANS